MIAQVRRWLPDRQLVVVADHTDAAIELLVAYASLPQAVTIISSIRPTTLLTAS